MEACVLGKQHERAVAFLEEMLRKEIEVDDRSFAVGIGACEAGKKVDKAMQVTQHSIQQTGEGGA
jgi:pentatricopeptide repeat protein